MLREEQIDLRRRRAREVPLRIERTGRKKVFSEYTVTNPVSKGCYNVSIRGLKTGDNECTCPDFRSNTLGTCKHIEAVLESVQEDISPSLRTRRVAIADPELALHYGSRLLPRLLLPAKTSDQLQALAGKYFDGAGIWKSDATFPELIAAIQGVPEEVLVRAEAMEFMEREDEQREMLQREPALIGELHDPASFLYSLLKVPLYEYQLRGAIFAACRGRSILGDDMGLGKTVQSMAAVEIMAKFRGVKSVLVVAPASVKYQWETEIARFTDRTVQVVEGLKDVREELYSRDAFYRLVNYEQVVRDLDELNKLRFDLVILDEAQRIRNWAAKTSQAVKKLRSRLCLVLTGTPLENRLEELYSIVAFVDDRRLGPAFEFLDAHRVVDESGQLTGYRHLDRIREKLAPIFLRRTRGEVLTQLPGRTDTTIYVELAPEQQVMYEEQRASLARLVGKSFLTDLDRKRILACVVNLRLICNSTWLYDKTTDVSPKLEEFGEIVDGLTAGDETHKAVVFSQWETMLDKAAEVLDTRGIGYSILHGKVPGRERQEMLARFRDDPSIRVFLSTDAGGTGLNLQTADTVIHLELPWNPAVLEQRNARVHRMGQTAPVRIIQLVARNTIEERVQKAIAAKKALFDGVFDNETDEVSFETTGAKNFLDSVREVLGEEAATPTPAPVAEEPSAGSSRLVPLPASKPTISAPVAVPRPVADEGITGAGVRMLEAVGAMLALSAEALTASQRERVLEAIGQLREAVGGE